jgi:hypothetical protein
MASAKDNLTSRVWAHIILDLEKFMWWGSTE